MHALKVLIFCFYHRTVFLTKYLEASADFSPLDAALAKQYVEE